MSAKCSGYQCVARPPASTPSPRRRPAASQDAATVDHRFRAAVFSAKHGRPGRELHPRNPLGQRLHTCTTPPAGRRPCHRPHVPLRGTAACQFAVARPKTRSTPDRGNRGPPVPGGRVFRRETRPPSAKIAPTYPTRPAATHSRNSTQLAGGRATDRQPGRNGSPRPARRRPPQHQARRPDATGRALRRRPRGAGPTHCAVGYRGFVTTPSSLRRTFNVGCASTSATVISTPFTTMRFRTSRMPWL